jgi:wyosine [tRNA(Phe)-imidazoG37] synthetase (radical SAM superfamily)
MFTEPRKFFTPHEIHDAVTARLNQAAAAGSGVDYLTFVPEGEPTLDSALGVSIRALRSSGIPVAVISNASLLSKPEVRTALAEADLVSLKVDSVDEPVWRRINRPHPDLELRAILQGIRQFADEYTGRLLTDTMLIDGFNDGVETLEATADFIASVSPSAAYLAVPTRSTTVEGVRAVEESGLLQAYRIFCARMANVKLLAEHETGEFSHSGDARDDLLAITAVHPMREDDVRRLLDRNDAGWELIDSLIADGELKMLEYEGGRFFVRPVRCGRHHI